MYYLKYRCCDERDDGMIVEDDIYKAWPETIRLSNLVEKMFQTVEDAWDYALKLSAKAHPQWDFNPDAHWSVKPYIIKPTLMVDGVWLISVLNPSWEA